jgi:GWxTD domain-containing protein
MLPDPGDPFRLEDRPVDRPIRALFPLLFVLPLAGAARASADDTTVDPRRFPRLVRFLLLPEERALLGELKDDKDRREFQRIFWARRDPTPGTAVNELEAGARAVWKRADELFSYPNQQGSETGCGQVLLLLGRPEEVRGPDEVRAPDTGARFNDLDYLREGTRRPETWVYRDRPGRPFHFTKAELLVGFDAECRFGEGGIVADDLGRAAAMLVARSELAYRRGPDGHLVSLERAQAAGPGVLDLLTEPRSDFPLAVETKLVTRGPKGTFVAGLARITPREKGGTAPGRVLLAFAEGNPGGPNTASGVKESGLARASDGSSVASWDLSLTPGRHQVTVAAWLPDDAQGSVSTLEVDVPDLGGSAGLVASPLILYPNESAAPASASALRDAYASFQVGPNRFRPRFGNVFAPQDSLVVVGMLFGAKAADTGRSALRARFTILKEGKPIARGAEDVFTTQDAVASVGPIPLSAYVPGAYIVRLEATDAVANQTLRQEAPFEIRPAPGTP